LIPPGGDTPEAVADALHAVLKLSWRPEAVKICVLISDAPPHGLVSSGDEFPEGENHFLRRHNFKLYDTDASFLSISLTAPDRTTNIY
jgi:hypothetical protein